MKIRSICQVLFGLLVTTFATGNLSAEDRVGSFYHPSSQTGLYKPVETKLKIPSRNFRKGNEDAGEPSYSAYPAEVREEQEVHPEAAMPEPSPAPDPEQPLPVAAKEPEKAKIVIPPPPLPEEKPVVETKKEKAVIPPPPVQKKVEKADIPAPPKRVVKEETSYDPPAKVEPRKIGSNAPTRTITAEPVATVRREPETVARIATPVAPPATYPPSQYPGADRYQPRPEPVVPQVDRFPSAEPMVRAQPVIPEPVPHIHATPGFPPPQHQLNSIDRSSLSRLREEANRIARQGIEFRFGRSHPAFGGLDSSGAVQFLLNEIGVPGVPRTTNGMNSWVRVNDHLREFSHRPSVEELTTAMVPGNLLFWGDEYSGRLTHVMIYLGYDSRRQRHLAFGTRGGTEVGINGSEVDIFTLKPEREKIVSTGKIPGLQYH